MALTSVLTCCAISILLVNVNLAAVLESSQPIHRTRRAVLSESPTEEFSTLISEQLSRANVQSLVKSVLPNEIGNLQSRLAKEDLLEEFLRSYVEDPNFKSSLLRAADTADTLSVINVLNSQLGGPILAVSNSSIVVNVDAIESLLITYSRAYIQKTYSGDFFLQIAVTGIVNEQIKQTSAQLRSYLADKVIPVECINALVSLTRESHRSKRDLNSLILDLIIRPQLAAFLTPIQAQVNGVLNNITTLILSFYTASQPTSPIFDTITNLTNVLILRVAEIVVVVLTNINAIFSNLINGTTTSTSRRRRDIDLEFDNFYDFSKIDLAVSHRRVARSTDLIQDVSGLVGGIIGGVVQGVGGLTGGLLQGVIGIIIGLLSLITANLNSLLKNVFMNILSSQYQGVGELLTTPVRALIEGLIDTFLPCSTCASIV